MLPSIDSFSFDGILKSIEPEGLAITLSIALFFFP